MPAATRPRVSSTTSLRCSPRAVSSSRHTRPFSAEGSSGSRRCLVVERIEPAALAFSCRELLFAHKAGSAGRHRHCPGRSLLNNSKGILFTAGPEAVRWPAGGASDRRPQHGRSTPADSLALVRALCRRSWSRALLGPAAMRSSTGTASQARSLHAAAGQGVAEASHAHLRCGKQATCVQGS